MKSKTLQIDRIQNVDQFLGIFPEAFGSLQIHSVTSLPLQMFTKYEYPKYGKHMILFTLNFKDFFQNIS